MSRRDILARDHHRGKDDLLADAITVYAVPTIDVHIIGNVYQEIKEAVAPVEFSLDVPEVYRFGHVYDLLLTYTNPNYVDVPAPSFELTAPNGEFGGLGECRCASQSGYHVHRRVYRLIAEDQEGLAGVLPPDYTGVYDIRFTPVVDLPHSGRHHARRQRSRCLLRPERV